MPQDLGKADTQSGGGGDTEQGETLDSYGLTVTPSEEGDGVVVTNVDPDSDASDRGIRSGDVIVSVNNQVVKNAADINKAITEASKAGRKAVFCSSRAMIRAASWRCLSIRDNDDRLDNYCLKFRCQAVSPPGIAPFTTSNFVFTRVVKGRNSFQLFPDML